LGVEEFSMNPTSIPVVKRVIRMTPLDGARAIARRVMKRATVEEVNEYVNQEMDHRFPDIFRFGRPLATNRTL
jgi:phosphoenolpyruvate-protein kinase (PTS system EI component)